MFSPRVPEMPGPPLGRSVSREVKRDLRNTVILSTFTYASETWTWNESQRSRV